MFAKWCDPSAHDQFSQMCTCARELRQVRLPPGSIDTPQMEALWKDRSDIVNKYFGKRLEIIDSSHPIDKLAKFLGSALSRKKSQKLNGKSEPYRQRNPVITPSARKVSVASKQEQTVFYSEPAICSTWDETLQYIDSIMDETWTQWKGQLKL